jgi:hypothetical protein
VPGCHRALQWRQAGQPGLRAEPGPWIHLAREAVGIQRAPQGGPDQRLVRVPIAGGAVVRPSDYVCHAAGGGPLGRGTVLQDDVGERRQLAPVAAREGGRC